MRAEPTLAPGPSMPTLATLRHYRRLGSWSLAHALPRVLPATAIALLLALQASPLRAQPLQVTPERPLSFGLLLPGVPLHVVPTDAVRSGQVTVFAPGASRPVRIWFTLPATLQGPASATLPLAFGPLDGRYEISGVGTLFDPRAPITLPSSPRTTFTIGGTAAPAHGQTPGGYTGVVVLTVMRGDL